MCLCKCSFQELHVCTKSAYYALLVYSISCSSFLAMRDILSLEFCQVNIFPTSYKMLGKEDMMLHVHCTWAPSIQLRNCRRLRMGVLQCHVMYVNVSVCYQELISRPKGGRSVQLRGTAFESERSRHFPYMDLFSSGA